MDATRPSAGYFRASLTTLRAIVEANPDPDLVGAWLVLRRFAYGRQRELTAAGAKKIAASLGITRPRAGGLLRALLAIRYGERGELSVMMTARDWNEASGHSVPAMRGNAPVYVMPNDSGEAAYLSDLLIPPGDARSWLAGMCELDAEPGLDALRLLILAYSATSCGDFIGADPEGFACMRWRTDGVNGHELGFIGTDGGRHYWLACDAGKEVTTWDAIEAVTGGREEAHAERFWAALRAVAGRGLLHCIAIVSDARGRLLYPLWVYGESHRARLGELDIIGNFASRFHREATRAGFDVADALASDAAGGGFASGLFICATTTPNAPVIRTVYAPTLVAPTPDNMAGMALVAERAKKWS